MFQYCICSVPLKEAVEAKRPLTRTLLESMIAEVNDEIEGAVARKDYAACAPLQQKLDELVAKRADLPTLQELEEAVIKAEDNVANAAAQRNFSAAASLQAALDDAKFRLQEARGAEGESVEVADDSEGENEQESTRKAPRFASRSELESEISKYLKEVDDAAASKDFKKATEAQAMVDELLPLRNEYISVEELVEKVSEMEKAMNDAITAKNFAKAGELDDEINLWKAKLEAERENEAQIAAEKEDFSKPDTTGDEMQFSSRADLETEIDMLTQEIEEATKSKNFKKASEVQEKIDELEKHREKLPTCAEMAAKLATLKTEMEVAIKSKNFVAAGTLDEEITQLEQKLEEEKKKEEERTPKLPDPPEKIIQPTISAPKYQPILQTPMKAPVIPTKTPNLAKTPIPSLFQTPMVKTPCAPTKESRRVSKLRPKKPLISSSNDSILEVTRMLASKRGDAALITSANGGLAGIITDTDITRRVVAKYIEPESTSISSVMTANPTCVAMSDSAMDALGTMVENHFRHLPVVDDNGGVVGLLDIAKCLNDAISKLERSESKKDGNAAADAVKQVASLQGAGGAQAAALQALLGPLMAQAFGNAGGSPTLRSLLAGKPATIVSPNTNLRDTGIKMAEARKASLVVENGRLVGIFGFKDMMSRAVAKGLSLEKTAVSEVMTPDPETVSPDITVLEALQLMHDNKFLTLPVCESSGSVVGLVTVMDVIYGCGGAEGWRSIFDSAMNVSDDFSDTGSIQSMGTARSNRTARTVKSVKIAEKDVRPVSKLRPSRPLLSDVSDSILSVSKMLASKRGAASLITSSTGGLAGIITDHDIVRRVVSKHIDPSSNEIGRVMTPNPSTVRKSDSAMDALAMMIENHYRYLPVVDDNGSIVGLLDIGKCLNDAITRLEKKVDGNSNAATDAMQQLATLQGAGANAAALQALLGPLMSQAFGNAGGSPTLRSILNGKRPSLVKPGMNVRECRYVYVFFFFFCLVRLLSFNFMFDIPNVLLIVLLLSY